MRARFKTAFAASIVFGLAASPAPAASILKGDNILEARLGAERLVLAPRGKTYFQPALANAYIAVIGDSITQNSGGIGPNGPTMTSTSPLNALGYATWLAPLSGTAFVANGDWNFGVSVQSSAGVLGRLTTTTLNDNRWGSIGTTYFTGTAGAASGATGSPISSFTFTYSSGAAVSTCSGATCPYVFSNVQSNGFNCRASSITGTGPFTVNIPATCGWTSAITTVVLSPVAQTSNFTSYVATPTGTPSATGVDVGLTDMSTAASGSSFGYSIGGSTAYPATVYFSLFGTNDGTASLALSATAHQTISNYQAYFAAMGPSGANKIVVMGDLFPRGRAQSWSGGNNAWNGSPEVHTIPSGSPYTVTVVNNGSSVFGADDGVYYAPCGSTTSGTPSGHYTSPATDYWSCGSAGTTAFSPGPNDGLALAQDSAGNCAGSGPSAAGKYCVSPIGVYTFNAADQGARIAINYRWVNNTGGASLLVAHDWLDSTSCSSWVDTVNGVNYTLPPGAQCPGLYPWVHVANTWAPLVDNTNIDPATGRYDFNKANTLQDGLHPLPNGAQLAAGAMLSAVPSGATPTPQFPLPSGSPSYLHNTVTSTANVAFSAGNYVSAICSNPPKNNTFYGVTPVSAALFTGYIAGNTLTVSSLTSGAVHVGDIVLGAGVSAGTVITAGSGSVWTVNNAQTVGSAGSPVAMGLPLIKVGAVIYLDYASGSGLPNFGATVTCVDPINGYVVASAAATANGYYTSHLAHFANDTASLFPNGYFSTSYLTTVPTITGCGNCWSASALSAKLGTGVTQTLPTGWTFSLDAGMQTAIANGNLGFGWGMETNPFGDGYDDIVFTFSGYPGTGSTLYLTFPGLGGENNALAAAANGNIARFGCEIKYSAGLNGRLTGIFGFSGFLSAGGQSAFTVPWTGSTTYTASSISFGSAYGGGTNVLNESMLAGGSPGVAGGVLTLPLVSPPLYKGGTLGSTPFNNLITLSGNDPVSGTIRIRRCKMWATTE